MSTSINNNNGIVAYYKQNKTGRDFVIGDIHGMFSDLEKMIEQIDFDPQHDRLFSVGDLIDRGPESHRVVEFLDHDWFIPIKGNHEIMLLESETNATTYANWVGKNGGEWWESIKEKQQAIIRDRIRPLPLVLEIETARGKVGVVHADISSHLPWDKFVKAIETDKKMQHYILWSRQRFTQHKATGAGTQVTGVKRVIVGHTPITNELQIGNVHYIDTGAAYTDNKTLSKLTIMQIHPVLDYHHVMTKKKRRHWLFG